jgi:hypothetical protein
MWRIRTAKAALASITPSPDRKHAATRNVRVTTQKKAQQAFVKILVRPKGAGRDSGLQIVDPC